MNNKRKIMSQRIVTALMTSLFALASLIVSASPNTSVVPVQSFRAHPASSEHLTELYAIASKGQLTVRALRGWGLLPENFTQLALLLRQHDIDLLSADIAGVEALITRAPQSPYLTEHVDELRALVVLMAGYAATSDDSSDGIGVLEAAINPPEYIPGTPAPTTATHLTGSSRAPAGSASAITLSDGTRAKIPALPGGVEVQLERFGLSDATDIQNALTTAMNGAELTLTGAVRQLRVTGSGDATGLIPELTIPASDLGTLNPATLNVLRVGDVYIDGKLKRDVRLLSATTDQHGNLKFVDPLLRKAIAHAGPSSAQHANWHLADFLFGKAFASTPAATATASGNWNVQAQYVVMTFQGSINWSRPPHLIRMIPEPENSSIGFRRPATAAERAMLAKQPLCNVMLLVHGHNEEEKGGSSIVPSHQAPWFFNYKRLVWDQFYQEITRTRKTVEGIPEPLYPYECTAFYELVYPTYRPIFSETVDAGGRRHKPLGAALGVLIQQELVNDPQLRAMIQNDMPFNAMIVAHSQGGLVARAGIRHMPQEFKDRAVRLVTWGTPHRGAPMYTLRYSFEAGHDMHLDDGTIVPLHEWSSKWFWGPRFRSGLSNLLDNHLAIDAPGIRDLRWEANLRPLLNMDILFPSLTQQAEAALNIPIYSQNLSAFNADTRREQIAGGYTFIVGETTKRLDLTTGSLSALLNSVSYISIGASLNSYLMRNDWDKANDGAVPLFSQQARGLKFPHPTKILNLGDIDHEEFFGGELAQRTADSLELGQQTIQATFGEIELEHTSRSCPVIENIEVRPEGDEIWIGGELVFPIYSATNTGGKRLGQWIERVELRERQQQDAVVRGVNFNVADDGSFQWQGDQATIPNGDVVLVAILKDGSEVVSDVDQTMVTIMPPRIIVYELQNEATEATDTFSAYTRPEGAYRYVWNFGDGSSEVVDTPPKGQSSRVSHTFKNLRGGETFYPNVHIYDLKEDKPIARDSISVNIKLGAVGFSYDCGWEPDYSNTTRVVDGTEVYYLDVESGNKHGLTLGYQSPSKDLVIYAICRDRGHRHGFSTSWYRDSGALRSKDQWDQGRAVGIHSWYFEAGRGEHSYERSGGLRNHDEYRDGMRNGLSIKWFENGQKEWEYTYKDDKQHGPYTAWYSSGGVQVKGYFSNGQRSGTWTWYKQDGSVHSQRSY